MDSLNLSLNVSPVDISGPDSAVVRTLGPRVAILRPAEWLLVIIEQGVLLLNSKPGLLILRLLHDLKTLLPLVCLHGLAFVVVGIAQDEEVVTLGEWAGVHLDWVNVDIAVFASSLREHSHFHDKKNTKLPDNRSCRHSSRQVSPRPWMAWSRGTSPWTSFPPQIRQSTRTWRTPWGPGAG